MGAPLEQALNLFIINSDANFVFSNKAKVFLKNARVLDVLSAASEAKPPECIYIVMKNSPWLM